MGGLWLCGDEKKESVGPSMRWLYLAGSDFEGGCCQGAATTFVLRWQTQSCLTILVSADGEEMMKRLGKALVNC